MSISSLIFKIIIRGLNISLVLMVYYIPQNPSISNQTTYIDYIEPNIA